MNIERLNINIGGITSTGFIGNDVLFDDLESLIGCKIPMEYIQFLKESDGGHPEVGAFTVLGEKNNDNMFGVDSFYSIDNPAVENVYQVLMSWKYTLGFNNLPIACDGGGNQIYMNLTNEGSSVWLYLHDEEGIRLKIANSFLDFLDNLVIDPDFI